MHRLRAFGRDNHVRTAYNVFCSPLLIHITPASSYQHYRPEDSYTALITFVIFGSAAHQIQAGTSLKLLLAPESRKQRCNTVM